MKYWGRPVYVLIFLFPGIMGYTGCANFKNQARETEDLTQSALKKAVKPGNDRNIDGNEYRNFLKNCRFFLSKDIVLRNEENAAAAFQSTPDGLTIIEENGLITLRNALRTDAVRVARSTPGILREKDGMSRLTSKSGNNIMIIRVLFEDSNDAFLEFAALYNESLENERFWLFCDGNRQIRYNGQKYTVSYEGGRPYLRYSVPAQTPETTFNAADAREAAGRN